MTMSSYKLSQYNKLALSSNAASVPKTQVPSSVPTFSKPGTLTSYITNDNPDPTNNSTTKGNLYVVKVP